MTVGNISNSGSSAGAEHATLIPRLLDMIGASWMTQAIRVACELELPDLLDAQAQSATELASRTGCDAGALHRLLRGLAAMEICSERSDGGRFELTAMGRLLVSGNEGSLRSWALWWGKYLWPVWDDLRGSIESGRSVRERRAGTKGYAHLERDAEAAAVFNASMTEISRFVASAALEKYDFSWAGSIVDVGGGYGEFLFQLLEANPLAQGVLYDLPHAVDIAAIRPRSEALVQRCRFVAGDFFRSVPQGADLYVLKAILHNWPDERARVILQRCREAMSSGARLMLIERVLPETMSATAQDRALARTDLNMLVGLGGRERTRSDILALLGAASLSACRFIPLTPEYTLVECVGK